MIQKLLVANRGEIALRIIRSCKQLGISTVAVFSEADRGHPFTVEADERVALGGTHAAETYLNQEKIISAALQTGADAIHPGYGFLSENADFCRAVRKAKLIFVGPSPETMESLGDKQKARTHAKTLGIPVPRGYEGQDQSPARLIKEGSRIGYPLMVKAAGAGGGRGMRRANNKTELKQVLDIVTREAETFFQDSQIILEQLIEPARHIEIQLLGDSTGKVLHFFERDCSAQRRFQKIVEIAPAEGLSKELLNSLYAAAVLIATEAKLVGAATAEFLVSPADFSFYFLEVNPRLQVEHPVTELITGVDLVELQIRAAAGEPIELTQEKIHSNGTAIEVRICSEIPEQQFAPSSGTISYVYFPEEPNIRTDHGLAEGVFLSAAYDSLVAKLIVSAETHDQARSTLRDALQKTAIVGISSNIAFLDRLLQCSYPLTTSFVEKNLAELANIEHPQRLLTDALQWHIRAECEHMQESGHAFYLLSDYGRGTAATAPVVHYQLNSDVLPKPAIRQAKVHREITRNEAATEHETVAPSYHSLSYDVYGHAQSLLHLGGYSFFIRRVGPAEENSESTAARSQIVTAPLPGTVLRIAVQPGEMCEPGALLLVIESMKMEHSVTAPRAAIVDQILVEEGAVVEKNKPLVTFKE